LEVAPAEASAPAEAPALPATESGVLSAEEAGARIIAITIQGNEKISTEEIRGAITSQPGEVYNSQQVEADRTAVRDLGWFSQVEVTSEPVGDGVNLVFRVAENEVIKGIELEGVTVAKPSKADLLALLKTKPGQVANQKHFAEDIAAIQKAYAEEGYVLAQVSNAELTDQGILKLTILESRIAEIRITGNTKTKTVVIQREMRLRPGMVYSVRLMQKDIERIYNLGFLEDVRAHPEVGPELGTVILVVEVVEKKRSNLATVGGGWASSGGFVGSVDVSMDNWKGTGQKVSVRGSFGGITSYETGYYNPWIAANHTSLNLSLYNRLTSRQVTNDDTNETIDYDERRAGGVVTFGRPLSDATKVFLALRRDELEVDNIDDSTISPDDPIFNTQSITSLRLSTINDTSDIARNPTRGGKISFAAEFAGLEGAKFNKYTTDVRRYLAFGRGAKDANADIAARLKRKVFATCLLVGKTTGEAPYLEQFLIGGSDTLRGYEDDSFVGTNLALLNTEFRFPINDTLQGVVFADAGDAWGGSFSETYGDSSFKLHASAGLGINVQSPLGPLRLQYGFGSEGGQLHFGFGQTF